ncbi:hypothetical protein DWZ54_03810 [Mitsuokella sp. AF33-22]|nr:hypothetical protein DWZ54_03810 [Mitsuokella sp. AF33-22]
MQKVSNLYYIDKGLYFQFILIGLLSKIQPIVQKTAQTLANMIAWDVELAMFLTAIDRNHEGATDSLNHRRAV